ncbi:MAG: hypothetical protein IJP78_01630 [Clostridia bacterium]|nr:hypothetical protein [Clostridia bacterium]MBQ6959657.1 hypothetical protein [Clostridia bacterium]
MRDRKRLTALLLCIGLLLTLAVSSAFIVLEEGHACSGEACEICESIAKTVALLRVMGRCAFLLLFAACLLPLLRAIYALKAVRLPVFGTLVCWKVRLND